MFASKITKVITIGDEKVTIRKLNHSSLELAREARNNRQAQGLRALGGDLLKALRSEKQAEDKALKSGDLELARKARYDSHDRTTVLNAGIASWTCGPVLGETIQDLEEPAAQLLFEEIVDLSLPSLDEAALKEAAKNA